jgi:hypothetical protein
MNIINKKQRVVDCRSMFCKAARVMQLILFVGNVIEPMERVVEVDKNGTNS